MKIFWAIISILSLFIGFDCSNKEVKVADVWARAAPAGVTSTTVYLTIDNKSGEEDTLMSVTSAVADSAGLQQSSTQDGMDQVSDLKTLSVAAGESKKLQPHQIYIVLKGLTKPLAIGDSFPIKLIFSKQGVVDKQVHVESSTATLYDGG